MKQSLLERRLETPSSLEAQKAPLAPRLPSYRPTAWPFVNRGLDIVDVITNGRAAWFQRFFIYAFIGGCAALVNMAVFYLVFYVVALPANGAVRNVIASVLAAEISTIANFVPNDYFTFRHLPGHQRSWGARCLRFHLTCVSGIILTFIIQFTLSQMLHMQPIMAQAIALMLALFYNFSVHHLFTYRRIKTAILR